MSTGSREDGSLPHPGSDVSDSLHRLSHGLIRKFGLTLKEFRPYNNQTWVLINGVRQRMGAVQADPSLLGYPVRADEVGKTAEQLFDESLRKVSQSRNQTSMQAITFFRDILCKLPKVSL